MTKKEVRKCKAVNPVDTALAKKKKVTLSVDTTECKYCGKLYHSSEKLTEHINQEHPGEQTIYACLAWSHKSHAAVDYTPIGVEPHGPTQGVWPIATVANDSQSHLVASSI